MYDIIPTYTSNKFLQMRPPSTHRNLVLDMNQNKFRQNFIIGLNNLAGGIKMDE